MLLWCRDSVARSLQYGFDRLSSARFAPIWGALKHQDKLLARFRVIPSVDSMTAKFLSFSLVAILMMLIASAEEEASELYTNGVIDLGIVVRDLDQSAKFYTEVVGLKEINGFKVPGKVTGDFGLTDNQDVTARVFVAVNAAGEPASKLKMMAFPKAQGKKPDQEFIHSSLGVSYLTLFVTDMDAVMIRLKKAGVKTLGKTPAPIGGANFLTVFRDPDGNFIELIGPSKKGG